MFNSEIDVKIVGKKVGFVINMNHLVKSIEMILLVTSRLSLSCTLQNCGKLMSGQIMTHFKLIL